MSWGWEERRCSDLAVVVLSAPKARSREFSARDLTRFPGKTIPRIFILHLPPGCAHTSHANSPHGKPMCLLHQPCGTCSRGLPSPSPAGRVFPASLVGSRAPGLAAELEAAEMGRDRAGGSETERRPGAWKGTCTLARARRDPKAFSAPRSRKKSEHGVERLLGKH